MSGNEDNPCMFYPCRVQSEKIIVLAKQYPFLGCSKSQLHFIGRPQQPCFSGSQGIYATSPQPFYYRCGDMFIGVVFYLLAH